MLQSAIELPVQEVFVVPIELRVSADLHTLAELAAQHPRLGRELADAVSRLQVFLPGGSLTTFEDFDGPLTAAGATHVSTEVTDRSWREQTWRLLAEAILLTVTRLEPAQHIHGIAAAYAPVLHLRRRTDDGVFATYLQSFERVWHPATPLD